MVWANLGYTVRPSLKTRTRQRQRQTGAGTGRGVREGKREEWPGFAKGKEKANRQRKSIRSMYKKKNKAKRTGN